MYTTRINIALKADEKNALKLLCEQERRTLNAQAAMLLRQSLEQAGLLQPAKIIGNEGTNSEAFMYTTRINIALKADEKNALKLLCEQERRTLNAQAAMLLRQSLEQAGLLQPAKIIGNEGTNNELPNNNA